MLIQLVLALVVLVYSALQTDLNRKCKSSTTESKVMQFVNIAMLLVSCVVVFYSVWHMFVPDSVKSSLATYKY